MGGKADEDLLNSMLARALLRLFRIDMDPKMDPSGGGDETPQVPRWMIKSVEVLSRLLSRLQFSCNLGRARACVTGVFFSGEPSFFSFGGGGGGLHVFGRSVQNVATHWPSTCTPCPGLHELRLKCRPPGANICARVDQLRWRIIGDKLIPPLIMGILGFHGHKKNLRNKVDIFIPYYKKNNGIYSNKTYIALPRNVNELILIKVFSANLFQSRKVT